MNNTLMNTSCFIKMDKQSLLDSATMSKQSTSLEPISRSEYFDGSDVYFGIKEVGVQTDLTCRMIEELFDSKLSSLQEQCLINPNCNSYSKYISDDNFYQLRDNSFLGNKRNKSLQDIDHNPNSISLQRTHIGNKGDIVQAMQFTDTNVSELSSTIKSTTQNAHHSKKILKFPRMKIDPYDLFKNEYKQIHIYNTDDELEKACKTEWNSLDKDVKRFYNMNAEQEKKKMKKLLKMKMSNEDAN